MYEKPSWVRFFYSCICVQAIITIFSTGLYASNAVHQNPVKTVLCTNGHGRLCNDDIAVNTTYSDEPLILPSVHLGNLTDILETHCALLCISPCNPVTSAILRKIIGVYREDSQVFIGQLINSSEIAWKISPIQKESSQASELVFYTQELKDRTCLLSPRKTKFQAEPYFGRILPQLIVQFMNEKCGVYRTATGGLTVPGLFHAHIMNNLYSPKEMIEECTRTGVPDQATFFQQFLFQSKPVIIEGGVKSWPAMKKWTIEYLKQLYGNNKIHIKLTEDGNFEGVESSKLWKDYRDDWIPEHVKTQLPHPDLVVVRPATTEMTFSDFLDLISSGNLSYSAYLEYSSIPFHLPLLEEDLEEMPFLGGLLKRRHLNIWLSDGNTLGKLHFDPFDNFLCQVCNNGSCSSSLFLTLHALTMWPDFIDFWRETFDTL